MIWNLKPYRLTPIACLALGLATSPLDAQTFFGGIRGRVQDTTSAAVANARVTLTDQGAGVERSTMSNAQGEYVFSAVNPATYRLSAEVTGFKRFERAGVIVATQAALVVDITLEVGAVTESVQVTAETPTIETAKADTGQLFDKQKLIDLPNVGRNIWLFAQVAPTIIWTGRTRNVTMHDQGCTSSITIAGGLARTNNYLIDGVPVSDTRNRPVIIPNLESIQEVKMQVQTYDAEMGRTGGGMFNSYTKSGTNELHGAGYRYFRPNDLYANGFFNNRNGLPKPTSTYMDWGGSLGGPIWIPKIYDGRNRTFFYFTGENYERADPVSNSFSVPTDLERVGDFSKSLNTNGSLKTIYDPFSVSTNVARTPFAGNVIPTSIQDKVGRNSVTYYPKANLTTTAYGALNYAEARNVPQEDQQETAKFDHTLTSWWRASLSYIHHHSIENAQHWWYPGSPASNAGWSLFRNVDATAVNNTITPNPTTVVAIRYGFNRFPNYQSTVSQGFDVTTLGFPPNINGSAVTPRFPRFGMQAMSALGAAAGDLFTIDWHSRNLAGSVSKLAGKHNVKMGIDFRDMHVNFLSPGASTGTYTFSDAFTRQTPLTTSTTGADVASLLLGVPASGSYPVESQFRTYYRYYAGYIHDDVRLRPNLTINVGIRYEWETGLQEEHNHLNVGFDRNVVNPIAAGVSGTQIPNLAPGVSNILPKGGLLFAGVDGNKNYQGNPTKTKFGPRFGVAWSLDSKTTIRGGFGIFWAPTSTGDLGGDTIGTWGYASQTAFISSNDGGITPANRLSNPFPSGITPPVGNTLRLLTQIGSDLSFIDQNRRGGFMEHYSFDVQRELIGKLVLSVGYIGSRGRHLPRGGDTPSGYNINELEPRFYSLGQSLFDAIPNPFLNKGGVGIISTPTVTRAQLLRPFPEFGNVVLRGDSDGESRYHALVLRTEKRFSAGLSLSASFTLSKNFGNTYGDPNSLSGGGGSPQTYYELDREFALSTNHVPRRFTATTSYELPVGRGKKFLNSSRVVDWALGGWQLNAIVVLQDGFPTAITQSNQQNTILFAGTQRPNATGINPGTSGNVEARLDNYFNSAAFSEAPRYTFGNISRTITTLGPGTKSADASIFKTFSFGEKWKAQFRAESFNVLNTPQFTAPARTWGLATFGKITDQLNSPRFFQMGARFFF